MIFQLPDDAKLKGANGGTVTAAEFRSCQDAINLYSYLIADAFPIYRYGFKHTKASLNALAVAMAEIGTQGMGTVIYNGLKRCVECMSDTCTAFHMAGE